ncbi:MAG: RHS repeat-associated core domain-containing protein [Victivallales bacterium]
MEYYFEMLYTYDQDGNLLSDGRFTYSWDGENRLISAESISSILPANKVKVVFAYDYMNRRVEKKLYNWQNNDWNLTSDVKSVYDGMNVIAEFDAVGGTLLKSYTWGLDLSGTLQGAGGVGGLVCVRAGPDVYFPVFDGNGNAVAYLDASGNKVAEFEYSPDPKIIVKSGPKADELAEIASFSTKPYDKNLDAFIYPFRILKEGRWLSRDPLGEEGGENLYGFVQNNSINYFDSLGLETYRFVLGVGYGLGLEQWKTFWENTVKNKMKGKFKDGKNNICFDTVSATKENIGNEIKDNNTYFFLVAHGSIFWKGDVVDNPLNPAGGKDENIAKQKNIEAAEGRALDIARLPFQKYGNDIESQTRRWRDAVKTWESSNPNYRGAKPEKPVYPTADQFKGTISEDDLFLKIQLADWKYYKPSEVPKNERLWWYGCHPFYMHNDTIQVSPSAYVNGVLSRRKFPILDIMNDKWLPLDVENIIRENIKEPKIGE